MREGANTKTSEEGRGGVPGAGVEVPQQPREKTMVKQVVKHPEDHEGPYATAGECAPKEAVSHGEPMLKQAPGRK